MKKILFLTAFAAILSIGCQTATDSNNVTKTTANTNAAPPTAEKSIEDFAFEFKTVPAEVKAEEQTDLIFTIKDAKGATVKNLQIVHEKPMHLIVVSDDLAQFYHLHPEPQPDGTLKVPFAFENGGKYKLYADFTPQDAKQNIKISDLTVTGNPRPAEELKVDSSFEKTVSDLQVTMKPDGALETGRDVMLSFNVRDAQTKQPVTDLQKYLGELAHFVIINKGLNEFVHAHPMSGEAMKEGEHAHESDTAHTDKMSADAPTVSAHVNFPKAGIYKIWAEFRRNGKVTAVPFVVDVKAGKESAPVSEDKIAGLPIPAGAMRVTVSKDGFMPAEITYKKGEPLKLAFVRTDADNCASEVVFKTLNITKKLPVGEVVTVDVPTDKDGVYTFACGMNMYKGQVIVQ